MDYYQAKEFFAFVFNWDFKKKNLILTDKNDVRTWRKLGKLLCHEPTVGCAVHEKVFYKVEIIQLFSSSSFIKYTRNLRKQIQSKDNARKTISPNSRKSRLDLSILEQSKDAEGFNANLL